MELFLDAERQHSAKSHTPKSETPNPKSPDTESGVGFGGAFPGHGTAALRQIPHPQTITHNSETPEPYSYARNQNPSIPTPQTLDQALDLKEHFLDTERQHYASLGAPESVQVHPSFPL